MAYNHTHNSIRYVFIALVLALTVGLASATVENTNTGNTYATIQEAIDNATAGDTIVISAGTYPESLVIHTPLTLQGALGTVRSDIIIEGDASSAVRDVDIVADDVTFRGLTVQGQAYSGSDASSAVISVVNVENILIQDVEVIGTGASDKTGINLFNNDGVTIEDVSISNTGKNGINVRSRDVVLRDISIDNAAVARTGFGAIGIYATDASGADPEASVTFEGDISLTNSPYGVIFSATDDEITVTSTASFTFTNTAFWPLADFASQQDVIINSDDLDSFAHSLGLYWKGGAPGSGFTFYHSSQSTAVTNIAGLTTLGFEPYLYNLDEEHYYVESPLAIQHAINAAEDGSTILVASGTYTEALTINKAGITLQSRDGAVNTIIDADGATTGVTILLGLGTIVVDGFTVQNFVESGIVQGMSQSDGTSAHIYNNIIIPTNDYLRNGIQVSGDGSRIIGNVVQGAPLTEDWAGSAYQVVNADGVEVRNNQIHGATDIGIALTGWPEGGTEQVANVIVTDNLIEEAKVGVRATYNVGTGIVIEDNTFATNGRQVEDRSTDGVLALDDILSENTFDRAVVVRENPIAVPTIFSSIQDAIDAASPTETVEVYPGTYVESLEILTNDITVRSVDGAATTIIDADGATNAVAIGEFSAAGIHPTGVTVEGFTVMNWVERGIAQRNGDGTVYILNNHVEAIGPGNRNNGIVISGGQNSTIRGNTVLTHPWTAPWASSAITLIGSVNALVEENYVSGGDRGISVAGAPDWAGIDSSWVSASDNLIRNNLVRNTPRGILVEGEVTETNILGNDVRDAAIAVYVFDRAEFPGAIPSGIRIEENELRENAVAVRITSSETSETPVLRQNNIISDVGVFSQIPVDARENWWGCSEGPSFMDCSPTQGPVSYTPWLCEEATSSLTSETDSCGLSTGTINVLYYDENASWTQARDRVRVWGQSPVGAREAIIDIRNLNQTVIDTQTVDVDTAGMNQRVYNVFFDPNSWPTQRLQIHINFVDSQGNIMAGYPVGTMFNDLFLLGVDDLVAQLTQELADAQALLAILEDDVEANADDITVLQQNVTQLLSDISQLADDIQALQGDFSDLAADVLALQSDVATLQQVLVELVALFNHGTLNWVLYDQNASWGMAQNSLRVFGQAPLGAETAFVALRHLNQTVIVSQTVPVQTITFPTDSNENSYQHFFTDISNESIYPREQLQIHVRFYDVNGNMLGYNLEGMFNNLYLMRLRDDLTALNNSIDNLNQTMIEEFDTIFGLLDSLIGHGTLQYRYYPETAEYKFQGAIPAAAGFNPRFWIVDEQGSTVFETTNVNDFLYGPHNPLHGEESFWKLIVDANMLGSGIFTVNMDFDTTTTAERWSVATISELALQDVQASVAALFEQFATLNSGTINALYYSDAASWVQARDSVRVWGQAPIGADTARVILRDLDQTELESITVPVQDLQSNQGSYEAFLADFSERPSAQYHIIVRFYMGGNWMSGYNVATMFNSFGLLTGPYPVITTASEPVNSQYAQGIYWTNNETLVVSGAFDDRIRWTNNVCTFDNMNINAQGDFITLRQNMFTDTNMSCAFNIALSELTMARDNGAPEFDVRVCGTPRELEGNAECEVITIGYDTQAPVIDINSLIPNETMIMSGNYTFLANVIDNGVIANVSFHLINKTNASEVYYLGTATEAVNNTWSVTFDTTTIPDGWYDYSVTATDAAGNTATVMIDPLVDNTAPVIHNVTHTGFSGTGHTISAHITDNYAGVEHAYAHVTWSEELAVAQVSVEVSPDIVIPPSPMQWKMVNLTLSDGNDTNGTWTGMFDFEHLGDFTIEVFAHDRAENNATSVLTDSEARLGWNVTLNPLAQTVSAGSSVQFTGTVTAALPEHAIQNTTVLVSGQEFTLVDGAFTANLGTLAAGQTHTIIAEYTPGESAVNTANDTFIATAQVTVEPQAVVTGGGGGGGFIGGGGGGTFITTQNDEPQTTQQEEEPVETPGFGAQSAIETEEEPAPTPSGTQGSTAQLAAEEEPEVIVETEQAPNRLTGAATALFRGEGAMLSGLLLLLLLLAVVVGAVYLARR